MILSRTLLASVRQIPRLSRTAAWRTRPSGCAISPVRMASTAGVDLYPHGLKPVTGGKSMESTLSRLGKIETGDIGQSNFVKPLGIFYELDGKRRKWDMVTTHPSVGIVIYNRDDNAILIVRQFRPPVYVALQQEAESLGRPSPGPENAFTYELTAGIIDKQTSLREIAADEVLEECGFRVEPANIQPIATYHAAIGFSGSRHSMFYTEVDNSMRVTGSGGGLADTGESIEVLALPLEQADAFVFDDALAKSPGLMFGVLWLQRKLSRDVA